MVAQKGRPPANEVYQELIAASAKGRELKPRHHDVVVRSENGATLFRIRHQRDSVALLLPLQNVAERTLRDISAAVANILYAANVQAADSPSNIREKPANDRGARKGGRPAVEAIRPAM
jgi:hypothetical protein